MNTVFASLPFYDSLIKQDRVRVNSIIPIHCPMTQLPPFLIAVGTYTASISSVKLISCDGTETNITSYFATALSISTSTDPLFGSYIQYNGTSLNTSLPSGSYYVKITKSDITYYSDWIRTMSMTSPLTRFIRIDFSNTKNIGNLRYENSFTQTVWLEAILNNPSHEVVNIGEEKDGIFIAEKVTTKFIYSVIAYISRGLYNCLVRLPQHDTITVTDEVGNTYNPSIGNIVVNPAEWSYFDVCKLVINFNDRENSNFSWTD
jgi:hypothetical protein